MGIWVLETSFTLATGHMTVLTTLWPVSRNSGLVYLSVCLSAYMHLTSCHCLSLYIGDSIQLLMCYSFRMFLSFCLHAHSVLLTALCHPVYVYILSTKLYCLIFLPWHRLPVTCTLLCLPVTFTFLSQLCLCLHTFHNSWSSCLCAVSYTHLTLPTIVGV